MFDKKNERYGKGTNEERTSNNCCYKNDETTRGSERSEEECGW
jgi:hypothetical protein